MLAQKKGMTWAGWGLSALIGAMLAFSASMKLQNSPEFAKQFADGLGYPAHTGFYIGIVELSCMVLYLIPQTSVLGAVLLTGYLGGAVATHVRVEEAFAPPVIAGVLVWLALFLRDPRIRELLPIRRALPPANVNVPPT